jgi:hypothetical protein
LTQELTKRRYEIKLNDLSELLDKYSNLTLSKEQMEAIWETFKVKKNLEENPEDVAERLVTCKALVSSGLTRKARRVDELISMQKEADFVKENKKLEGLVQVDQKFLQNELLAKFPLQRMKNVWRAVKDIDND